MSLPPTHAAPRDLGARATLLALAALGAGCAGEAPRRSESPQTIDVIAGLTSPVTALVDQHGIPHVFAAVRRDAAFALGWFHARDRLLQMDLYRRAGHGRVAELLGPAAIEEDRFARIVGLSRAARRAWEATLANPEERAVLEGYAAGVNLYLERTPQGLLPAFYTSRGLRPEPWSPVDCFAVHLKLMAELSLRFDDLFLAEIAERLGPEAAEELFPLAREATSPAVRHPLRADGIATRRVGALAPAPAALRQASAETAAPALPLGGLGLALAAKLESLPRRLAPSGAGASNNWVVSGRRSASGRPILCADPHLAFCRPGVFYTAQLASPRINVLGLTLPGLPVVLAGHNGLIAWSGTGAQLDVCDFFVETVDVENLERYRWRNRWLAMESRRETIAVRGGEPVTLTVRRTRHGPVVSDLIAAGERGENGLLAPGRAVSLAWTGSLEASPGGRSRLTPGLELLAFLRINAARDLREFLDALRLYAGPAMHLAYADVHGAIALRASGLVPRRARGLGRYPVDGARGDDEWVDAIPFEEMPLSVDPPEGFLFAANQMPVDPKSGYPYHLGWAFDAGFRARRIEELLAALPHAEEEDLVAVQLDTLDTCLRELVPLVVRACLAAPPADPVESLALRMLQGWGYEIRAQRPEPTIAWAWLREFRQLVWGDDWEAAGLGRGAGRSWGFQELNGWQPPLDVLVRLCRDEPKSKWFDDRHTSEVEDRDALMRRAFTRAVQALAQELGPGVAAWSWGNHNQLVLPDVTRDPNEAFAGGPISGNPNTISPGGAGGAVTFGAVYRLIVPLGNLREARGAAAGFCAGAPIATAPEAALDQQLRAYRSGRYLPWIYAAHPAEVPPREIGQRIVLNPPPTRQAPPEASSRATPR